MNHYLTAGFGEPLGASNLQLIENLGFVGIKTDIPAEGLLTDLVLSEASRSGLNWLWLWKPNSQPLANFIPQLRSRNLVWRGAIEVIGEPDTGSQTTPEQHALLMRTLQEFYPDMRWVLGGISGLHQRGFNFLRSTMAAGIPEETIISFHPYRTTRKPDDPFYYRTRAEEFAELQRLANGRPLWATECGWHTAPHEYTTCFFRTRTRSWTEDQVADFAARELELQRAAGVQVFTWFQLNDGPEPDNHEHHYGLRRMDGSLKPVAEVFK